MGDDREKADQNIERSHERYQHGGDFTDHVSGEKEIQGKQRRDKPDHGRPDRRVDVFEIDIEGRNDIKRLQSIEAEGERRNQ